MRNGFAWVLLGVALILAVGAADLRAETVTVDFTADNRAAQFKASGTLHGLSATDPLDCYVRPLRLKLCRAAYTGGDTAIATAYSRLVNWGTKPQVLLSDDWGYPKWGPWGSRGHSPFHDDDNLVPDDFSEWRSFIHLKVQDAKDPDHNPGTNDSRIVEWDIWNEPDNPDFWPSGDYADFFDTWEQACIQIRTDDPNSIIVGPSIFNAASSGSCQPAIPCKLDQTWMGTFIDDCISNTFTVNSVTYNCLPNKLSWHAWNEANIPSDVAWVKTRLGSYLGAGNSHVNSISLNEYTFIDQVFHPGSSVAYFANIENAAFTSAVDISAARTCWDSCGSENLGALLTDSTRLPTSTWWAYKGYADVTATLVRVTPGATTTGVAGGNFLNKSCRIVLGRTGGSSATINLVLNHLPAYVIRNNSVRVVAKLIADSGSSASYPTPMINSEYPVSGGSITVALPSFGPTDAYTVALSPRAVNDYDGDGTSDLTLYRQAASPPYAWTWWIKTSSSGYTNNVTYNGQPPLWGTSGDTAVAGINYYDTDGVGDIVVYRPGSPSSTWFVLESSYGFNPAYYGYPAYGSTGAVPVSGDYDGDGRGDYCVYYPGATYQWYVNRTTAGTIGPIAFGTTGDIPVPGDYNADGKTDIAYYRPSDHKWYVKQSPNFTSNMTPFTWGASSAVPVPGDYDGDGLYDYAYYVSGSTYHWHIRYSTTGQEYTADWGTTNDVAVPGDYDGDGRADLCVWRPGATGRWYVIRSSDGTQNSYDWGTTGDVPVRWK